MNLVIGWMTTIFLKLILWVASSLGPIDNRVIAVSSASWIEKFENWRCKALPREVSNHYNLIGYPFKVPRPQRAPFMVQKMWFLHGDFLCMVSESWNAPAYGSPDFIYPYKLKRLKIAMKDWNLRTFVNMHSRLKQDQLRFETAALISDEDPSNIVNLNAMKDAMATLSETRLQHVTMLKQKSRNNWLVEGSNKFNDKELDIESDLFDFEHDSISIKESQTMDKIPSPDEIKQAVFDLGANSAPGTDGFSGCFYRHCWDIIQEDLIKAIVQCWNTGHIPNGILATRLCSILDKLVSEEQVAFMKGRNIHENISLASEMLNELHFKLKDGNIGFKLDISQDFDTSGGLFQNYRGLHQGDPISPLIFVLIEDVLSRNITKLFRNKKMTHMVTRGGVSPSHLFFADDIMIFCKDNTKSLHNLVDLLGKYQRASDQTVCRQKSKIYYGGGSSSWCTYLANYLGMSIATFPDRYLGVQIMPGIVRYRHICNVVEKIKNQLAGWKGRLLFFFFDKSKMY
ncbi:uncharacterized protein LOC113272822 [Papaver somniferum]|uniref:uncharacterized protein LOC113272822 n=1 Tax=Papaver somniferum TaxID=3469 RepID=UPI000E6F55EA|nr:uncharacterized protein LOC113272822 [Papaver somniferum]